MSYKYSVNKFVQDSAGNLFQDELAWEVYYTCNDEFRATIVCAKKTRNQGVKNGRSVPFTIL